MKLAAKKPCPHEHQTLVQDTFPLVEFSNQGGVESVGEEQHWFACWQCNDCGAITQKPVTADDLEQAGNLPWLDEMEYRKATKERLEGDTDWIALQFAVQAKQPRRNGHR